MKVVIHGSKGRMGQALLRCAAARDGIQVVGEIDQGDELGEVISDADAVIDFTLPPTMPHVAELCARHGKVLVSGTTGLDPDQRKALEATATQVPVVWASNFSTGVNTLFWLTRKAAEILGPAFDLEVVEMHHRLKQDAPSGTATTLAEILAEARQLDPAKAARHGRAGVVGERTRNEIGVHAIRGGDVVGDHTVVFAGSGERVELSHKASSRDTFANGALRAAAWALGRSPGLYDMGDVLGLNQ